LWRNYYSAWVFYIANPPPFCSLHQTRSCCLNICNRDWNTNALLDFQTLKLHCTHVNAQISPQAHQATILILTEKRHASPEPIDKKTNFITLILMDIYCISKLTTGIKSDQIAYFYQKKKPTKNWSWIVLTNNKKWIQDG